MAKPHFLHSLLHPIKLTKAQIRAVQILGNQDRRAISEREARSLGINFRTLDSLHSLALVDDHQTAGQRYWLLDERVYLGFQLGKDKG